MDDSDDEEEDDDFAVLDLHTTDGTPTPSVDDVTTEAAALGRQNSEHWRKFHHSATIWVRVFFIVVIF